MISPSLTHLSHLERSLLCLLCPLPQASPLLRGTKKRVHASTREARRLNNCVYVVHPTGADCMSLAPANTAALPALTAVRCAPSLTSARMAKPSAGCCSCSPPAPIGKLTGAACKLDVALSWEWWLTALCLPLAMPVATCSSSQPQKLLKQRRQAPKPGRAAHLARRECGRRRAASRCRALRAAGSRPGWGSAAAGPTPCRCSAARRRGETDRWLLSLASR